MASLKRSLTAVHGTVLGLGGVKGEQETLLKGSVTTWDGNKEGWGLRFAQEPLETMPESQKGSECAPVQLEPGIYTFFFFFLMGNVGLFPPHL